VPEPTLDRDLAAERSRAVRTMLRDPLLHSRADPETFRNVVRHRAWLGEWFETTCGWPFSVDVAAGFARLHKRSGTPDQRRPLVRTRGAGAPFDRRRYQLLCLVCAELVRHPATTVGLLASSITPEAGFDSSRHAERVAFVDALRALMAWGAVESAAGDVDAYMEQERSNALLTADTAHLHRLLASVTAASALDPSFDSDAAVGALCAEPRYGEGEDASDEQRRLWMRHTLARRLLDDPAVHLDELSTAQVEYAANPAGRRWLRERVAEAGLELEERAEGFVAVDPDGIATDRLFPAPQGNAHQLALLLVDHLLDWDRRPVTRTRSEVQHAVGGILERFPGWARAHREDDGPDRLVAEALALLADLGLVRLEADGSVTARPALARYRAGEPTAGHRAAEPATHTLFEEPG